MAKDILTDENGAMRVLNGDLEVGYSDEQHIEHILLAQKGDYKQHPLMGVGIIDYLKSPKTLVNRRKLDKDARLNLEADGALEIKVAFDEDGKIKVAAGYGE